MAQTGVLERSDAAPSRPGPPATTVRPPHRGLLVAVLVVAAVITALGLRAHAMWFDELQAWNIARSSHSLGDLYTNLRYEGHPILWYLPLYALTRVTGNPHSMQVVQWCVATATFALVLFRAPFSIPIRVAVIAGYCFAFEYGVISRSYGLSALLVIAALVFLGRREPSWAWGGTMLVLLAWTSLPGAVLAIAVAVAVAWVFRAHFMFVGTVLVAAAVSAYTCIPPSDFSSFAPGLGGSASKFGAGGPVHVASAVAGAWRGLIPIPASVGEWNSNVLDHFPGGVWLEALLAIALFVVILRALRDSEFARTLWWIGSLGYAAFFVIVMLPEQARYAGFPFLLFLACAWLSFAPPEREPRPVATRGEPRELLVVVLIVVLAAQIVATVAIYPIATTEPFSRDEALAQSVHRAHLDDAIVSGQDWDGATVGAYLDRPVYSVVRGEWIQYFIHDEREARRFGKISDQDVLCDAARIAVKRQTPVAVIVDHKIRGAQLVAVSEDAALYRIDPDSTIAASGNC
jgi:hypothetical protein